MSTELLFPKGDAALCPGTARCQVGTRTELTPPPAGGRGPRGPLGLSFVPSALHALHALHWEVSLQSGQGSLRPHSLYPAWQAHLAAPSPGCGMDKNAPKSTVARP